MAPRCNCTFVNVIDLCLKSCVSVAFAREVRACSPEKILKNGAIWCVLESILLKFCPKNNLKNSHFLYKNNR